MQHLVSTGARCAQCEVQNAEVRKTQARQGQRSGAESESREREEARISDRWGHEFTEQSAIQASSIPDRIRTCNLRLRRPTRYPVVPRGRNEFAHHSF